MCGIAGIVSFGDWRPSEDMVKALFIENMSRGRDATGIGYLVEKEMKIVKDSGSAEIFIGKLEEETLFPEITQSNIILMHTRFKTKGAASKNDNNHPVVRGDWAVVHNGQVLNDDEIFKHFRAETTRLGEVDTAAIPLVLQEQGIPGLGLLMGSSILSAWNKNTPDTILIAKTGTGPLSIYFLGDFLLFSSNPPPLSIFPKYKLQEVLLYRLGNLLSMPTDTYLEIKSTKEISSGKIKFAPIPLAFTYSVGKGYDILKGQTLRSQVSTKHADVLNKNYPRIDLARNHPPSYYDRLAGSIIPDRFETVFGQWQLAQQVNGTANYVFRPSRSVKKWYRRKKEPRWWDGETTIVPKRLLRISGAKESHDRLHYICGFCGVCLLISSWLLKTTTSIENWMCPFCEQPSTVPSIEIT